MRRIAVALAALLCIGSAARGEDAQALRKLAKLPTLTFQVGVSFSFSRGRGLRLWWEKPDLPAEIASLEKSLKGDPWDAERVHRIGELAREMGDDARAGVEFRKAVGLYRERLKSQSGSGILTASLGQALADAGDDAAAEKTLRDAVRVAPNEWRSWMLLGQFLENRTLAILSGAPRAPERGAVDQLLGRALSGMSPGYAPLPAAAAEAQRCLDESRDCYDRSVAAAMKVAGGPASARACVARGTSRGFIQAVLRGVLAQLRGEKADPRTVVLSPESLADLQRAADLDPSNVETVALVGLCEAFGYALRSGTPLNGVWQALPEASKAQVSRSMERLDRLSRAKDPKAAAAALDALGVIAYVSGDEKRAESALRGAVKADPSREQTWEMLAMVLGATGRYADLAALCKERLAYRDTSRTRLLLAKAYEKLDRLADAEDQVRTALRLAPDDYAVTLGLAALVLRRADTPMAFREAAACLDRAERAVAAGATPEQWLECTLTRALHLGLTGDTAKARAFLKQILERDPGNQDAQQGLAALDG